MSAINEPIAYDNHGHEPFDVLFQDIPPQKIDIYLQMDTRVGIQTCRQRCAHCFFNNQPATANKRIPLAEGKKIAEALSSAGYNVFPMVADSFADKGTFLVEFGGSHNRHYGQEADMAPSKTMERGEAWTSGAPLMGDDAEDLLATAVANGFGSITITYHGILDEKLEPLPHSNYPIKGVFPGEKCAEVIERIHAYNTKIGDPTEGTAKPDERLAININITIGKHNYTKECLSRYVRYFSQQNISVLRFNRFYDHGGKHPHLSLREEDVAQFYKDIASFHQSTPFNFQLGLDGDFGTSGIEVMGFPPHVGWCRAGRQLFAIVPEILDPLPSKTDAKEEKIGTIAACVDLFKPIVGHLVRVNGGDTISYRLHFFEDIIEELRQKRINGTYTNGCFASELLG